ncbi:MAG: hypothetical protein JXA89_13045, partial [Anaerolineae bacterium]|nr:hypothetical protein [Anaerolineae bacterium]
IDIAPNGTVVAVSYWPGALLSLYPDDTGLLTVTGRYTYTLTSEGIISETGSTSGLDYHIPIEAADGPGATGLEGQEIRAADVHMSGFVNVAVAPDGQTVLVCDVNPYNDIDPSDPDQISYYAVGVYRIIAPGVVTFTGVVSGLERATQSIAFSTNGTKAYLAGNGGGGDPSMGVYRYNHLSVLNIDGPGVVSLDKVNVVEYPRLVSSQLFGVDTIAVVNGKAYLGYPTLGGASYDLQVVNLSDYSVKRLDMPSITTGVGVISPKRVYLPFVVKSMP